MPLEAAQLYFKMPDAASDIEITVDDPKAYTAPWTVTLHQNLKIDTELLDYICLENEKDIKHMNAAVAAK